MALMAPATGLLGGITVLESKRIGPGPCSTQVGCANAGAWLAILRATSMARVATRRRVAFTRKSGLGRLCIVLYPSCISPRIPFYTMAPPQGCVELRWKSHAIHY